MQMGNLDKDISAWWPLIEVLSRYSLFKLNDSKLFKEREPVDFISIFYMLWCRGSSPQKGSQATYFKNPLLYWRPVLWYGRVLGSCFQIKDTIFKFIKRLL